MGGLCTAPPQCSERNWGRVSTVLCCFTRTNSDSWELHALERLFRKRLLQSKSLKKHDVVVVAVIPPPLGFVVVEGEGDILLLLQKNSIYSKQRKSQTSLAEMINQSTVAFMKPLLTFVNLEW